MKRVHRPAIGYRQLLTVLIMSGEKVEKKKRTESALLEFVGSARM